MRNKTVRISEKCHDLVLKAHKGMHDDAAEFVPYGVTISAVFEDFLEGQDESSMGW